MKKVVLTREKSHDWGTAGVLDVDKDLSFRTLELRWLENKKHVSCIPCGHYFCERVDSPKFGLVYQVKGVPGRGNILIHSGNYAGDVSIGLKSDVKGCILIGHEYMEINGQKAIIMSKLALTSFVHLMNGDPFELTIKNAF